MRGWEAHGSQVAVPAVTVIGPDPPTYPPTALKNRHLDKVKSRPFLLQAVEMFPVNVVALFLPFYLFKHQVMPNLRIPRIVNFTYKKRLGEIGVWCRGTNNLLERRKINFALGRRISQSFLTKVKKIEHFHAVNSVSQPINC
jgi:hypothetical protein